MKIIVKRVTDRENWYLRPIAKIASQNFSGLADIDAAYKWVTGNWRHYPRFQYFVAESNGDEFHGEELVHNVLGYILWQEKGGFRPEAVFELEQIVVREDFRQHGIAKTLIRESLDEIQTHLRLREAKLKLVEVTTGSESSAQTLYKKALGAAVNATIPDFFRGDEVIMIARFLPALPC